MIYLSYGNYFKWYYDDVLYGRKSSINSKLKIFNDASVVSFGSFKTELINNANKLVETYPGKKFSILLSGGSESETIIRTYKLANIDFKAYIFRYEKDINIYDVSYAVSACESIGADYKIIDFNIEKFFNLDAEKISEIAQIDYPRALVHCKFLDYIQDESVIIAGLGATGWSRTDTDYSKKGSWINEFYDREASWERYVLYLRRNICMSWFRFSPELVLAHHHTKWATDLRNDKFKGKLGVISTKLQGYKEAFPEMLERKKKNGLENAGSIIEEFESFLFKKNNGFPYRGKTFQTYDQICKELLGIDYKGKILTGQLLCY
jgi:hypothetical protein